MKVNKTFILFVLILSPMFCFSQENKVSFSSVTIEYTQLLSPTKSYSLPYQVQQSEFYQYQFSNYGNPNRVIEYKHTSNQIILNTGFEINHLRKKVNHEIWIGIGFQRNNDFEDKVYVREGYLSQQLINGQTYYISDGVAKINMTHKSEEILLNTAWLFKTRGVKLNAFVGIGGNLNLNSTEVNVEEIEKNNTINTYSFKQNLSARASLYLPVGWQYSLLNKRGQGFLLRCYYSLRIQKNIHSGFSFSLGYTL